jgi:hypothetical protein
MSALGRSELELRGTQRVNSTFHFFHSAQLLPFPPLRRIEFFAAEFFHEFFNF